MMQIHGMFGKAIAFGLGIPFVVFAVYALIANRNEPQTITVQVLNRANLTPVIKAKVWFDDSTKSRETDRSGIARIEVPWRADLNAIQVERRPFQVTDRPENFQAKISADHYVFLDMQP